MAGSNLRNDYVIMHMDREVARVSQDGSCRIYSAQFMPFNLYLEEGDDLDIRVNNLTNFYYWCSTRVLTLDRRYAKEILSSLGLSQAATDRDRAAIAISYHALTLTDVFWVRSIDEHLSFTDISLYDHSLSDAFVEVSLRGRSLSVQNAGLLDRRDSAGDVATQGVAPKAWIRRNGTFYLLKNGDMRDVEAELLASSIADCFAMEHVRYTEDIYDGVKVSSCEIITSPDRSIVPMEHAAIFAANNDMDLHQWVLDVDAYAYYSMNIIDYLVGNTDRHWGNWGFMVDNASNEVIGLHPLMDLNKAFSSYDTAAGARCQTTRESMSQMDAAVDAVRHIGLNQLRPVHDDIFTDDCVREMFRQRLEILSQSFHRVPFPEKSCHIDRKVL